MANGNEKAQAFLNDLRDFVERMSMGIVDFTSHPVHEGRVWVIKGREKNVLVVLKYPNKHRNQLDRHDPVCKISEPVSIKIEPDDNLDVIPETVDLSVSSVEEIATIKLEADDMTCQSKQPEPMLQNTTVTESHLNATKLQSIPPNVEKVDTIAKVLTVSENAYGGYSISAENFDYTDSSTSNQFTDDADEIFIEDAMNHCEAQLDLTETENGEQVLELQPCIDSRDNHPTVANVSEKHFLMPNVNVENITSRQDNYTNNQIYPIKDCFVLLEPLPMSILRKFNIGTIASPSKTKTLARSSTPRHQCFYCKKVFTTAYYLKIHERYHTGEKPYKCSYCDESFMKVEQVRIHEQLHTGKSLSKCMYCDKSYSTIESLKRHLKEHAGIKPFACSYCDKRFTRSELLQYHERSHTGEQPYQCSYCDKRYSISQNLRRHEQTHLGVKGYVCSICSKTFGSAQYLRIHTRFHTGEKPYHCHHCNETFTLSRQLKAHESTHTGIKPYECSKCGKQFSTPQYLKIHEMFHVQENPYFCSTCNRSFVSMNVLKNHEQRHKESTYHQCTQCSKIFYSTLRLKRHELTHLPKPSKVPCKKWEKMKKTQSVMVLTQNNKPKFILPKPDLNASILPITFSKQHVAVNVLPH